MDDVVNRFARELADAIAAAVAANPQVEACREKARAAGAKRVISLPVSGAFHSPLVEEALEPLREEFERTEWHTPDPAFFSGCTVKYESADFNHLLQVQLISPVRFSQSVKTLYEQGYDSFLEVGPGAVLTGLVKRIEPRAQIGHVSDMETLLALRGDGRYLEDA